MKTGFISTASLSEATRLALSRAQIKLADAQKELATGRHADVGRTLGATTARTVSLRQELGRLATIADTNSLASARLDASQASLDALSGVAEAFVSDLIAVRGGSQGATLAADSAKAALSSFAELLGVQLDGAYLFAGVNSDMRPVADYFATPPGGAKVALDAAFLGEFGVSQSDPAVGSISAAAMQSFLDGNFKSMFDPPAWNANWSTAADQNVKSRISTRELIEISSNANAEPFRQLAQAFAMIADLGIEELGSETRQSLIDAAIRTTSAALAGLTSERAVLGQAQERVRISGERISIQLDLIERNVGALESVDAAEVATRVSALSVEIETAYALTARLQRLSLLDYL